MSHNYYTSFLHISECDLPAYFYSECNYLPIYNHSVLLNLFLELNHYASFSSHHMGDLCYVLHAAEVQNPRRLEEASLVR